MTREQAINYLFSSGFTNEQVGEVVRALTYEPTTKNNLGVDCISREQALVAIRNLYPSMPRVDFNGSLRKWVDKYKPYIECDDAIKQLPSVTPQYSSELEKNSKKLEKGITKNDLGVECIKKSDAIYIIQDMHGLARADVISDAVNRIITMPTVTPQEPRKVLSIDDVMSVFDDFMCGEVDEDGTETFLEMLKDKAESEPQESEVEDGNDDK